MSDQEFWTQYPSCLKPGEEQVSNSRQERNKEPPMVAIPYDVFLDVMAVQIKDEEPAPMLGKASGNTVSKKKKKEAKLSKEVFSKSKLSVDNEMKTKVVMGEGGKQGVMDSSVEGSRSKNKRQTAERTDPEKATYRVDKSRREKRVEMEGWERTKDFNHNNNCLDTNQQVELAQDTRHLEEQGHGAAALDHQDIEDDYVEMEVGAMVRRPREMAQGLLHPSVKTEQEDPSCFKCKFCPVMSTPCENSSDVGLAAHVKKHYGEKGNNLPCSVEGCRFKSNYLDLVRHLRLKHTKQFLFVCEKCDHKMFNCEGKLAHIKKHDDAGKKQCSGCKKFFSGRKLCKCKAIAETEAGREAPASTL